MQPRARNRRRDPTAARAARETSRSLASLRVFLLASAIVLASCPAMAGETTATVPVAPSTAARWLAGDHHIHSRFSVGWKTEHTPPTPILGGDAIYPIPMNALMARRFGLSWTVTTDHGGPNHSRVHMEHAYPELLVSREAVPQVIQFYGMELNTPGADHSTWIMARSAQEAQDLHELESRFDTREAFPVDPGRNSEGRMLEALKLMSQRAHKPVVIANHPSRSATAAGVYGLDAPAELRSWSDAAPRIAIGMEGAPGHQAATLLKGTWARAGGKSLSERLAAMGLPARMPRGAYSNFPTLGGFDQMTARLGGFWDSMLGERRRWWITATSDSHIHHEEGGMDFWPGEYSKTYVFAEHDYDSILEALRSGRIFVTTGDLVSELYLRVRQGDRIAEIGGTLEIARGSRIVVEISFLDPDGANHNGDHPKLRRVDLIRGAVRGPVADPSSDANASTEIIARFESQGWRAGALTTLRHVIEGVTGDLYLRVRGTNTAQLEPERDTLDEDPWQDLWFYSNPVFVTVEDP